jgi:hypothetical protein
MHLHRLAGPLGCALIAEPAVVLQLAACLDGIDAGAGGPTCALSVTLWDELARSAPAPCPTDPAGTTAGFGIPMGADEDDPNDCTSEDERRGPAH